MRNQQPSIPAIPCAEEPKPVRIVLELSADEARGLYLFTKRVRFEQALELTDCWLHQAEKIDLAYHMIHGLAKVNDALLEKRAD